MFCLTLIPQMEKKYSTDEITVHWKPEVCIHSRICWTQLRNVFDPTKRPWINVEGATAEEIIAQVKKCPSGAISYTMNNKAEEEKQAYELCVAEVSPNGPLLVRGEIIVKDAEGNEVRKSNITAFCRCGASGNKPYCDGSHRSAGFTG
ncbi:MAG: (4Fe-4S)-binding protein [Bacteroidetes bacterium]|nr:(4Fe-4S)-binding protein [Bacteroidota bacterium]